MRVLYTVGEKTAEKLHAAGFRAVRDVRERPEEVIRLLGKQGRWLARLAAGIDDRSVVPYRPQDAKSIGREVTFQQDVEDHALLRDVLFLLALCVEDRACRVGLYGRGVTLKLTYSDMRGITRSRAVEPCARAVPIWRAAAEMLGQVERRPVRLVGVSLHNLSPEEERQLAIEGFFEEPDDRTEGERQRLLETVGARYGLDLAGNLDRIFHGDVLHKTVEYMRTHPRK